VVSGSIPMMIFVSCLIECMNLYYIQSHTFASSSLGDKSSASSDMSRISRASFGMKNI
jgi:hypothetical protein